MTHVAGGVDVLGGEGAAQGEEGQSLGDVGERLVVHEVPVKHVELGPGHRVQVLLQN